MVNESKCLLLFPLCGMSRVITRTVARKLLIGGFVFLRGGFTFVQGCLTFQKLTKTPLIYSVSCFNLGGLGVLFGGAKSTKDPRGDGTGGHVTDCYFCMTNIRGFSRKNMSKISYPVRKSAIKPVPHDPDLAVTQPPTEKEDTLSVNERASTGTESEEELIESDPSFQCESAPFLINQERLNDLVRDLYLSQEKAEVLWSTLQQWNLLKPGTTISFFHSSNDKLACYYASEENKCYCKDIHKPKRRAKGCRGCGRIPHAGKLTIFWEIIFEHLGKSYSYIHI